MKTSSTRRKLMMWSSAGVGGFLSTLVVRPSSAIAQSNSHSSLESLSSDRTSIINTVNGIAIFADLRDWQRCRQSFTDRVDFDYTSLLGGQPMVITADEQMRQWSAFFSSTFKSTQHIVGSHVVTIQGNTATCLSNFQAHHTYLDTSKGIWILSGYYEHGLTKQANEWKVNRMKMSWTWEDGTRPF